MLRKVIIFLTFFGFVLPAVVRGQEKTEPEVPILPGITIADTIHVVGSILRRGEIPGSVHRIDYQALQKQNQAFDDIHRILFRVPGINIQEEDGFGLRPNIGMRGTGSDRSQSITLMEDAVLIAPAPYAAPSAYYFPVAGRMNGIEVRKGSSQIKYGPRTNGGALNLVSTPVPKRSAGHVNLSVGEDNARKIYANYGDAHGRVSWLLETYQIENDGFKRLDTGGDTGFDVQDYVGKIVLNTSADDRVFQKVTLKLGYNEETSFETYLGLTDADFEKDPFRRYAGSRNDEMTAFHRQFQARHLALWEGFSVTTTAYRNEFERNWYKLDKVGGVGIDDILVDPVTHATEFAYVTGDSTSPDNTLAVKANNREYYSQGIESNLKTSFELGLWEHEVEAGVRYHADQEDRFQHSDGYRMERGGAMVLTNPGVPGASGGGNNRVNSADAVAIFVQDNITFGNWIFAPGVRYEHIEMKRDQYQANDPTRVGTATVRKNTTDVIVPGIGINYRVDDRVSLFAGVHKGFAPPGPGAVDATDEEESINYELGGRYTGREIRAQFLGFFNDYDNLLGKDTFSGGGSGSGDLHNAGEVQTYGVETSLDFDLTSRSNPGYSVPLSVAYTYTVSEFQTSFKSSFGPWGNVQKGDGLPYVPSHQFTASLGLEQERWNLGFSANYVSKTATEALQGDIPDNKSTDARVILDATAEYGLTESTRMFVSMQNLTGNEYLAARRPAGVRPGLPRRVLAGIKLSL